MDDLKEYVLEEVCLCDVDRVGGFRIFGGFVGGLWIS